MEALKKTKNLELGVGSGALTEESLSMIIQKAAKCAASDISEMRMNSEVTFITIEAEAAHRLEKAAALGQVKRPSGKTISVKKAALALAPRSFDLKTRSKVVWNKLPEAPEAIRLQDEAYASPKMTEYMNKRYAVVFGGLVAWAGTELSELLKYVPVVDEAIELVEFNLRVQIGRLKKLLEAKTLKNLVAIRIEQSQKFVKDAAEQYKSEAEADYSTRLDRWHQNLLHTCCVENPAEEWRGDQCNRLYGAMHNGEVMKLVMLTCMRSLQSELNTYEQVGRLEGTEEEMKTWIREKFLVTAEEALRKFLAQVHKIQVHERGLDVVKKPERKQPPHRRAPQAKPPAAPVAESTPTIGDLQEIKKEARPPRTKKAPVGSTVPNIVEIG